MKFRKIALILCCSLYHGFILAQDADFSSQIRIGITGGYNSANGTLNEIDDFEIENLNSYNIGISTSGCFNI